MKLRRQKERPAHCVLRMKQQGGAERSLDLVADRYTVGRIPEADGTAIDFVFGGDPSVSRHQCNLHAEGGSYVLENVSAQGTQVNSKVHHAQLRLRPGDEIWLGDATRVRFDVLRDLDRSADMAREFSAGGRGQEKGSADAEVGGDQAATTRLIVGLLAFWVIVFFAAFRMRDVGETASADSGPAGVSLGQFVHNLAAEHRPRGLTRVSTPEEGNALLARARERFEAARPGDPHGRWFRLHDGLLVLWQLGFDSEPEARETDNASVRSLAAQLGGDVKHLRAELEAAYEEASLALEEGDDRHARRALRSIVEDLLPWQSRHPLQRWAEQQLGKMRR